MTSEKSPDAYRTISEVASSLELPQHILRFWETKFNQIKPLKRGGGRRYYRPEDVDLLKGIRHLLYSEGYTIKGVQKIIKERGASGVVEIFKEKSKETVGDGGRTETDSLDSSMESGSPNGSNESPELFDTKIGSKTDFNSQETDSVDLPKDVIVDSTSESGTNSAVSTLISKLGIDKKTQPAEKTADASLSKKDLKHLNDTLLELLECKRILDNVR